MAVHSAVPSAWLRQMWRKTHEPPPGSGGISVARNGAIVIYDDSPAVRLTREGLYPIGRNGSFQNAQESSFYVAGTHDVDVLVGGVNVNNAGCRRSIVRDLRLIERKVVGIVQGMPEDRENRQGSGITQPPPEMGPFLDPADVVESSHEAYETCIR